MQPNSPIATFSPDSLGFDGRGQFRYTLWRSPLSPKLCPDCRPATVREQRERTARATQYVQFIGCNPSTASETVNDPTLSRCMKWAREWGFGSMLMTNLWAYRSPLPSFVYALQEHAVGPNNNQYLREAAAGAGMVVAAWGLIASGDKASADHCEARIMEVSAAVQAAGHRTIYCLGLTASGKPKHPMARGKNRIADTQQPEPWLS